ncbi:MAG: hypothetical protein SOR23_00670, partial [Candidatus Enterosoma sp.]|nr:hypothetical protein [Bacilli bacterium]MDY3046743.1 hypothetical protein [Candidatus Enterosoma sp.]
PVLTWKDAVREAKSRSISVISMTSIDLHIASVVSYLQVSPNLSVHSKSTNLRRLFGIEIKRAI